jgi:hypothetical protein
MSSMLNIFTNLQNRPNKEETMARINEDPSLKHILDEIETGGPAAMMRSKYQFYFIFVLAFPYFYHHLLCKLVNSF